MCAAHQQPTTGACDQPAVIDSPGQRRWSQLRLATWGTMEVSGSDQGAGRLYRCACGWEGWSSWGHARRHAASCPQSGRVPDPLGLVSGRP